MAFWTKDVTDTKDDVCITVKADTGYAGRFVYEFERKGFICELVDSDEDTITFRIFVPASWLEKALSFMQKGGFLKKIIS